MIMAMLIQDIRYGARMLYKRPALTLIIVVSMALGIGANTTVFTWMENLVLNPYPLVKDGDRLVAINAANTDGTASGAPPISYPTYQDWRDASQSFEGLIAESLARLNLRPEGEAQGEAVWAELVSCNYFDVLGARATLGRALLADEEQKAAHVAVISDALWHRKFAGDRGVIGRHVTLNGVDITIVGVMPRDFHGVLIGYGFDLWVPVTLQPLLTPGGDRLNDRKQRWLQGTARLRPGVALGQAVEEMKALSHRLSEANGEEPPSIAVVRLMRERFTGSVVYPLFSVLLAVTGLVLLIACANIANLLLARAAARQREIGVRLALGASRLQIVRQLLIESLLLSLVGGVFGLLVAMWAKDIFINFIPPTPAPVFFPITINTRVIAFSFIVTLLTALIFGLVPALRASKPDLIQILKDDPRAASAARSRFRGVLVVAQVALSLVALVCAALFLRGLQKGQQMHLGFNEPGRVLLVATDLNIANLKPSEGAFVADRLLEGIRALPGVTNASLSTMIPLGFGGHAASVTRVDGYVPGRNEQMSIERVIISNDYFETMGIPILRGRAITDRDRNDSMRVTVINEAFARRYWPDQDPLGKRVDQGQGWSTVVGVAKNSKYRDLDEDPYPVVYSSYRQTYAPAFTLQVRTTNEPRLLAEPVRNTMTTLNANLPFLDPRTLLDHIGAATIVQFIGASMLSVFGSLALALAAVGLYGVLSYIVSQRRREIAIRMAIGAAPRDVLWMILKQGLVLTATGSGIGAGLALAAGRLLGSNVPGVAAADPLTFGVVTLLLGAVAALACYVPARRATKVDPMAALRSE
jgi:putative ABC transport system permease protein